MYFHILRDENRRQLVVGNGCDFFRTRCVKARNKCAIKKYKFVPLSCPINVSYLSHQLFISYPDSSTCRDLYTEADVKTNDVSRTRAAWETAKNWRRGEKLKNVCARHLVLGPPLCLLVEFASAAVVVAAAVAGNGRRRLPQQPATATTS